MFSDSKYPKVPSRAKCPKCKSNTLRLREVYINFVLAFDQDNGVLDTEGLLVEGDPDKVKAECVDCGHRWTLRGVSQITQIEIVETEYPQFLQ